MKIAVSCWNLSHNCAGRALTLLGCYQYAGYDVSLIGTCIGEHSQLWEPLLLSEVECLFYRVKNVEDLAQQSTAFVKAHPFDVVHLSKPRLPNILLGQLYKKIWNAKVIMDVDDEELSFLSLSKQIKSYCQGILKKPNNIRAPYWTRYAVSKIHQFDEVTVSNVALQRKYGGTLIPHVRDERLFHNSMDFRRQMRQNFNLPQDKIVVLFFGSPKRHKGIIETANAIRETGRKDMCYVVVGDFTDNTLKEELLDIQDVEVYCLPNQPYDKAHEIIAIGDICVLYQDMHSNISKYQLPAKMVDALAMGLTVFATPTEPIKPYIEEGVVIKIQDNLVDLLRQYRKQNNISLKNIDFFRDNLSYKSVLSTNDFTLSNKVGF